MCPLRLIVGVWGDGGVGVGGGGVGGGLMVLRWVHVACLACCRLSRVVARLRLAFSLTEVNDAS